jgi:serine/threonine-protein kinase
VIASPDDADGHARAAWDLVQVYSELGNDSAAREVADGFMARRAAWAGNPRGEDWALAADVVPLMLAAQRRAGSLDEATFTVQRDAWLSDWEAKLPSFYSYDLWLRGFAAVSDSEARGKAAAEAMPRFGTMRDYGPILTASADHGHVWLLAGDATRASSLLERATRQCTELREPIAQAHARLWLGQAREAAGDKAGACAAYRSVLSRWPRSSRSRTTATAAARVGVLGC